METMLSAVLEQPVDPARPTAFPPRALDLVRPVVRGKFLYEGDEKLFVRGVTYGAFAPNSDGDQFPERDQTSRDFALMQTAGINTILTYTVPPMWMLDLAMEHRIRVLPTVPWMEYVCFLESRQ
ncbi:MAG: glycosyl transferase, partial [Acidobacteria bacterium]